ncbi:hypothetical protein SECTIM467_7 [Brevibacillus phage SecTim467]|uniref:Uncharacterized protein n=2 Tax=Jenstvirus jenst TaxID=1982225 RepID=A0A0K2CPL5_9CAUD|nr:hypothetical protein AVV11_gp007 [Brevibacillus phage Jenst]ALA07137.1 hypothetical protein JENST_7 [Brevibacillus phage Jenst]ALA07509.1 hypothetical protein SECTIM467_7 [Brevibacillus phage SecTim467]
MRRNMYLRARKDRDLLQVVKDAGLDVDGNGDFAHFIRELMRDGVRYRHLVATGQLQGNVHLPVSNFTPPVEDESERLERKYGATVDEGMLAEGEV